MGKAELVEHAFDPAARLAEFQASHRYAGAIVSFTGQMRPAAQDGMPLTALHLEGYRGMTQASIDAMVADAGRLFAITGVLALHRIGGIAPGEAIVFVATAAEHRRAAFDAADWLMDQLKSRVILWKREERADGSNHWIEPTAADRDALARWDQA
jgi:molybdopterin synthase catalytic subunit